MEGPRERRVVQISHDRRRLLPSHCPMLRRCSKWSRQGWLSQCGQLLLQLLLSCEQCSNLLMLVHARPSGTSIVAGVTVAVLHALYILIKECTSTGSESIALSTPSAEWA